MVGTVEVRREELKKLYSPWEEMTFWSRFEINARKWKDQIFVICDGVSCTYGQIYDMAEQIASGLYHAGIRGGDHVAVCMRNRIEYVVLTFALAKLSAVKVPVNVNAGPEEFRFFIRSADAIWLITDRILVDEYFKNLKLGIITMEDHSEINRKVIRWNDLYKYSSKYDHAAEIKENMKMSDPDTLCDIVFTSGSASRPKAIMIHHDMLLRSAYGTCFTRCMEIGRRIYVPIPFFHTFAYVEGLLAGMLVGGSLVISTKKYSADRALVYMRDYRVNDIICVSYIMMNILEKGRPGPEDYPGMHACYFASSCPQDTWQRAREAFGITDVSTGYGMAECGSTTAMISPEDPPEKVSNCHGKIKRADGAVDSSGSLIHVRILDPETGKEPESGLEGEICCRGFTVMHGYYKNDSVNRQCFDSEGWFHTGDLGRMDQDGYLEFLGRKDDTYKINGENVSPIYLDSVIGQCEHVKVVETVGIPHDRYGEVGVAFIEPDIATGHVREEIFEYCRQHLAHFQIPEYIIFGNHDEWPRTDTGKIKKRELKRIAEQLIKENGGKYV